MMKEGEKINYTLGSLDVVCMIVRGRSLGRLAGDVLRDSFTLCFSSAMVLVKKGEFVHFWKNEYTCVEQEGNI